MSARRDYFQRLTTSAERVSEMLLSKGVEAARLTFGGVGSHPTRRPYVPVDANSNFLGNRALGDWAESTVKNLIDAGSENLKPVPYGDTSEIAAGDEGFKDYYLGQLEATRVFGKRPDLLLFSKPTTVSDTAFSENSVEVSEKMAKTAFAAVEVRSSKFKALTYMRVREEEKIAGKKGARECPSFTVKVEDMIIVYRWMQRFQVPQIYCQVFLDSIFAINFLNIFEVIGSTSEFKIETPKKSQEKATIMIPITIGKKIATCSKPPEFRTEIRETRLGRVDAFVAPVGGEFKLDSAALEDVLLV